MRVLVTGFGPFDDVAENPSGLAVKALAGGWDQQLGDLITSVLPVSFGRATQQVRELLAQTRPDLALHCGLAANRRAISIERVGLNLIDARIPDTDGYQPIDQAVLTGAPPARWATLPVKAVHSALTASGSDAELSTTAGLYVCNAVMFASLDYIATTGLATRSGFVHVPPAKICDPDQVAQALTTIITTAARTSEDEIHPAGHLS